MHLSSVSDNHEIGVKEPETKEAATLNHFIYYLFLFFVVGKEILLLGYSCLTEMRFVKILLKIKDKLLITDNRKIKYFSINFKYE